MELLAEIFMVVSIFAFLFIGAYLTKTAQFTHESYKELFRIRKLLEDKASPEENT
jgi:hypothetical protein